MNKKQWAKKRNEIREHIRRSQQVSDGAFRLWDELATGWAWSGDHSAFPKIDMLADALGKGRTTIKRLLNQLVELGLVEKKRRSRGNTYVIVAECPEALRSAKTNQSIAAAHRERVVQNRTITESDEESQVLTSGPSDGPDVDHRTGGDGPDVDHRDGPDVDPPYKPSKGEPSQKTTKAISRKQMREPSAHASPDNPGMTQEPSRCALGNEPTEGDGDCVSYTEDNELEGLIEDPIPRPRPRKKRAADKGFVPGAGRDLTKGAYPEAQGGSQSLDHVNYDPGAHPPPVTTSEGLLWRLKGEVEEKWGKKATRGFPDELTSKLSGQIKNAILRKYPPDVIQDMVRLLVWDWEVARGVCFPFRPDVPYPDVLAFVQYAKELASRIESGFDYPTARRGSVNTYKDLFIKKKARREDEDPFWR